MVNAFRGAAGALRVRLGGVVGSRFGLAAAAAGVTAVALLGVAGCGGSTPKTAAATPAVTISVGSTPVAKAGGTPTAAPSPSVKLPSIAELSAALLTASELGPAFTKSTDSGGDGAASGCKPLDDILNSPNTNRHASANYQAGQYGPFVSETLSTEAPAAVSVDYQQAKAAITSCRSITLGSGGQSITFALTPMNFGGDSAAARLDGNIGPVQVNGYLVIGRVPSALLGYTYMQLSSGSSQMATALYSQAESKAQRVLGGTLGQ